MAAGLSIRAYALRRGVSHTAVRKALAAGRITTGADGGIDPAVADVQWSASTDVSKQHHLRVVPKQEGLKTPAPPPSRTPEIRRSSGLEESEGREVAEAGAPRLASSYAASRAAREAYMARLAKLDFEQKSGKLVDADEVRAQIFALGRRMRDAMLGLPDRLAPVLAGQADPAAIHRVLTAEIVASLSELSGSAPLKVTGSREVVQ